MSEPAVAPASATAIQAPEDSGAVPDAGGEDTAESAEAAQATKGAGESQAVAPSATTAAAVPGMETAPEPSVIVPSTTLPSPMAMPEPPALAELPQPPALGESGSPAKPLAGPYASMPPAPAASTYGQPGGYAAPMGTSPGYPGQRRFEPQPPPGFSSPLPLPGPGFFDPYAGYGADDELREPPPPSTAEDVWREQQAGPDTRRRQTYYGPRVPGQSAPYMFPPGRSPYGGYPYTR